VGRAEGLPAEPGAFLEAQRPEIEAAAIARIDAIADPGEVADPAYLQGLRAAVDAALSYAFDALDSGGEDAPPPPPVLLAQARLAARVGVGLDTVLRRYFAGYTLLGDFLAREAEAGRLPAESDPLMRSLATVFDRLVAAVSEAYEREASATPDSAARRRAEEVEALLAGEPVDLSELAYELDAWHIAALVAGPGCKGWIRELADGLDRRALIVGREDATAWLWLGSRQALSSAKLADLAAELPERLSLAIGEPGHGLAGWRLSHRQAAAALSIAQRGPERLCRYADVALLAATLNDKLLCAVLKRTYLDPIEHGRDGGRIARETLRAYFQAGRNVSSAAAILRASRNTVGSRLRAIEEQLGRPLSSCGTELEIALDLEALRTS